MHKQKLRGVQSTIRTQIGQPPYKQNKDLRNAKREADLESNWTALSMIGIYREVCGHWANEQNFTHEDVSNYVGNKA